MQCFQSAKPMKAVWHGVTRTVKAKLDFVYVTKVFQNVNKHVGILKEVKFSPTWTIAPPFSSRGFYLSVAYVQCEFGESAASIRVRLLIKCGFYTRLYGSEKTCMHVSENQHAHERKY